MIIFEICADASMTISATRQTLVNAKTAGVVRLGAAETCLRLSSAVSPRLVKKTIVADSQKQQRHRSCDLGCVKKQRNDCAHANTAEPSGHISLPCHVKRSGR